MKWKGNLLRVAENIFKTMDAITNAISDACEPRIRPEVTLQTIEDKTVIVAHRSYLEPGNIQVAIFDDRLEVTSPGMLLNK